MKTILVLTKTEIKMAVREFSGVLFGVIVPAGLMLLLGGLYDGKMAEESASYTLLQQAFPAVVTIGIIATGLMGIPLTITNYRDKKILKRFMVTPTSPFQILIAQGLNGLIFSTFSTLLVFAIAKIIFGYQMIGNKLIFWMMYLLVLGAMYSLGFMIASVARTVNASNLLTSLAYFPMLFLSGATIPYEIMPTALQKCANIMPLTHGIKLLKIYSLDLQENNVVISIIYLLGLMVIATLVSVKTFRWE